MIEFVVKLSFEEGKWCASVGDDLHGGVAGFGSFVAEAMKELGWELQILPPEKSKHFFETGEL